MNTNTSLDALHDIYIPVDPGFLPLTPGYIALSIFLFSLCISFTYLIITHYKANTYKREALKELVQLKNVNTLFLLIKRVMLSYNNRENVAKLSGTELINTMNMPKDETLLLHANKKVFNPKSSFTEAEFSDLKQVVHRWIKRQKAKT